MHSILRRDKGHIEPRPRASTPDNLINGWEFVGYLGLSAAPYFSVSLLNLTVRVELPPGGRLMLLEATLPDSTQTIRSYSSSPKSGICRALAIHGFHTTVD